MERGQQIAKEYLGHPIVFRRCQYMPGEDDMLVLHVFCRGEAAAGYLVCKVARDILFLWITACSLARGQYL